MDAQRAARYTLGLDLHGPLTAAQLRQAYRARLLQHHPDKVVGQQSSVERFTVDEIRYAFNLLSQNKDEIPVDAMELSSTNPVAFETVCIDEFEYVAASNYFYLGCRCGDGYIVTDNDLELGRTLVECGGCSLWIEVDVGANRVDSVDSFDTLTKS